MGAIMSTLNYYAALAAFLLCIGTAMPLPSQAQEAPGVQLEDMSARDLRDLIRSGDPLSPTALEALKVLAHQGDRFAAQYVGDLYRQAAFGAPDLDQAVEFYRIAIEHGSATAAHSLADMYLRGDAPSVTPEQALAFYEMAVAASLPRAMQKLGDLYRDGILVEVDGRRAASLYRQAAELGRTAAVLRLGDLYRDGNAPGIEPTEAVSVYKTLADAGDTTAMLRLGDGFRDGVFGAKDKAAAEAYYTMALDTADDRAYSRLVDLYFSSRGTHAKGIALLEEGAKAGKSYAIVRLADAYLKGTGTKVDVDRAVDMLAAAAANQDVGAARRLIRLYVDGHGSKLPPSPERAAGILAAIAPQLDPDALTRDTLGVDSALARTGEQLMSVVMRARTQAGTVRSSLVGQMGRANPNAYVALLQDFLASRGTYSGPISGLLTQATISAFNAMCTELDRQAECLNGPLSPKAARLFRDVLEASG